jgi:hypothetical protein
MSVTEACAPSGDAPTASGPQPELPIDDGLESQVPDLESECLIEDNEVEWDFYEPAADVRHRGRPSGSGRSIG